MQDGGLDYSDFTKKVKEKKVKAESDFPPRVLVTSISTLTQGANYLLILKDMCSLTD